MISRFINKFRKTDGDEQRAFQNRVLNVLREIYPGKPFSLADDPLSLRSEGEVLGLTNLRSHFLLTTQTDADLRTIVADHFGGVWASLGLANREGMAWNEARSMVMPQLMPEEFLTKLDLASFEFGGDVVIGLVIDSEKAYSYVTADDLARWDIDKESVYASALANLDGRSLDLEATVIPGENGLIVVNTLDSFDAARILLPRLQGKFAEILGSPFNFGVPNRDFLICWSRAGDDEFQNSMRTQIAHDCEERPYPLSPFAFEASEDGSIEQLDNTLAVSPVQNAELN